MKRRATPANANGSVAGLHKAGLPLSARRLAHKQVQPQHLPSRAPVHNGKQYSGCFAFARQARDGSRFRASVRLPHTKSLHKSRVRREAVLLQLLFQVVFGLRPVKKSGGERAKISEECHFTHNATPLPDRYSSPAATQCHMPPTKSRPTPD